MRVVLALLAVLCAVTADQKTLTPGDEARFADGNAMAAMAADMQSADYLPVDAACAAASGVCVSDSKVCLSVGIC